ncbi:fungal-specific transcription factor domain-containing protein [Umbelopsis sp. AD052]|nr:fungal-specific transcription factor domain-containing protein [Umbelopsis sp. AD052]
MTPPEDMDKQKRFKVGRACYTCRQKKIKCDGLHPCMQCKVRRRPCSFAKDGKTDIKDWTENAEGDYDSKDMPIPLDPDIKRSCSPSIGEQRPFKRAYSDYETNQPTEATSLHNANALASSARKQLFLAYFKFRHEIFAILPRKQLLQDSSGSDTFISPLLQNSIFAHAADHLGRDSTIAGAPTSGTSFFTKASYMTAGYMDQSRLSTIAAFCLMSLYHDDHSSSLCKSWMYSGMAFRMAVDVGFQIPTNSDQDIYSLELRKRILWGCYVLDKIQSLMSGKHLMITGHSVELDYPTPLPNENALDHAVLDGFVAMIRLMQICERVLHFEFFIAPHTKEHEQASLDLSNELLNWLRMLPEHLQWTPLPQANSEADLQPPSSAMIANLHLCYNLVEVRVLQPYALAPGNKAIRSRCWAVVTNILQLVDFVYEDPSIVFTPFLIVHAAERSAQLYIHELNSREGNKGDLTQHLFSRAIIALKHLHQAFNIPEAGVAVTRLETAFAQASSFKSNTMPVNSRTHLSMDMLPKNMPQPSPNTDSSSMVNNASMNKFQPPVGQKEASRPTAHHDAQMSTKPPAFRYRNGDILQEQRTETIIHGLRNGSDPVFSQTPQFEQNRVDPFAFDTLQVDSAGHAQWDVQQIPSNDPTVNGPVKLQNYDYYMNAQNLPRRIRLFTPYPTYNIPQPSTTRASDPIVSDALQESPSSVPSHASAHSQNFPLSISADAIDHHTADQLLSMETDMSHQNNWDAQSKWYQDLHMETDTNATSRDELQRQTSNHGSVQQSSSQAQSYRGIGLGVYASAQRHHTDVISQQTPLGHDQSQTAASSQISLTPPYQSSPSEPETHKQEEHVIEHHHLQFSTQATA